MIFVTLFLGIYIGLIAVAFSFALLRPAPGEPRAPLLVWALTFYYIFFAHVLPDMVEAWNQMIERFS